nr:hypothetical protein [Tanacetum cinerariifolium]
ILSENEVTSEDKRECDMPVYENSPICDDHFKIFSDSNNDDDISSDDNDFEDIEYVEALLPDPEIVSVEEENVVYHEEEEELVPIPSENEVTSKDKKECDVPVCENSPISDDHSEIFFDSNNDDDISSDNDAFEDIEYVEASLPNLEIVSLEEENDVHQEEEEFDLEEIQDVILREKLLSINRLIANIESLNDNPTPDCVLNSFASIPIFEESDNSLSDNFSPEFETFCYHTEETRSGNTTTHANDSLPEYDSFCFEIEPDQERLTSANFRVIHKSSISLNNTSQISPVHAVAPILSTKEPEYSPSMGYEHLNTTSKTESDEIIKSGVEELVPIPSENEVTSKDKKECFIN